jgi:hypothetical protein
VPKKIDIDWLKEKEDVRNAIFAVIKAHDIYESLSPGDKERFNVLLDMITDEAKELQVVPSGIPREA